MHYIDNDHENDNDERANLSRETKVKIYHHQNRCIDPQCLSIIALSRTTTITLTRLDYLTVTGLNYTHKLINKLGQESQSHSIFFNIHYKAIKFGLLIINQTDISLAYSIYKLNYHIWYTDCRLIEGDLQKKTLKKLIPFFLLLNKKKITEIFCLHFHYITFLKKSYIYVRLII